MHVAKQSDSTAPFMEPVSVPITDITAAAVRQALTRALAFPKEEILRRYAKDHRLPLAVAQEHETEFCKYFALCAVHPEQGYGMKGPVDGYWHTFLLFTRNYQAFCNAVASHFVHHVPISDEDKVAGQSIKHYTAFLQAYEQAFAAAAPIETWPRPHSHDVATDCGCDAPAGCSPIDIHTP
jgi:hypothetical protein